MSEPVSLIPIKPNEVAVGKPLRQTVYDWHGNVLLEAGVVIETSGQLDGVLANGYFPDSSWDDDLKAARAAAAAKKPATPAPAAAGGSREIVMSMEDVHWYVGETLYLQHLDNAAIRYTVRLIGFVKNKTVFVTAPVLEGKFQLVRDGQMFVVRAFPGKKAYAFTAAAVKSVHTPHPYLHLSYPKQVKSTTVRQSARIQVKIVSSITLGEPERTGTGLIIDLSSGGASAISKEPLGKKGEAGKIKMKVHVEEQDAYLNLNVILRSVSLAEAGEGIKHGFEFIDTPIQDRLVLSAFVNQTLAEVG